MSPEKSLRLWRIKKENRADKKQFGTWIRRKEFIAMTKDKNCFGKITKGIEPERMTDDEYAEFIKGKPETKLML